MNQYRHNDSTVAIKAQLDFALKYVTDIVSSLVKDAALASQVNDAITAKLTDYQSRFVNSGECADFTVELK